MIVAVVHNGHMLHYVWVLTKFKFGSHLEIGTWMQSHLGQVALRRFIRSSPETGISVTCPSRALTLKPLAEAQKLAEADQLNCRDSITTICSPYGAFPAEHHGGCTCRCAN